MGRTVKATLLLIAGILVVWFAPFATVEAHESRPAYLEVSEFARGQYSVLWRTPVLAGMPLPVVLQFPKGVSNIKPPLVQHLADSDLERRWIDAGPEGLSGKRIEFPGLELTITDAIVKVELLDGRSWMSVARPSQPWVAVDARLGRLAVAFDFLRQGVKHMLSGPDHLLFVFGLLLLVRSPWMLVKTITAFTVAHSITLAAATLGYVRSPDPPIEAAIAMSILFLGVEVVRAYRGETSFAIRHPWIVAFAFGLLHGFGFANIMSAAGLPRADLPLALVSFNVGVELGQLAFVAVILLLVYSVRRVGIIWPRRVVFVPAYVVGVLGAYWTIERVVTMETST